jgi:AraC-like DNA-binding protein
VASISVLLLRPVVAAAGDGGDALLRAADLTPEMLADDDGRVTPAQFCVAWAELARLANDPQIALSVAAAIPPGAFGVVEYVCRAAPTLGDALRNWCRYLGILDDAVDVELVLDGDRDLACLRVTRESVAPAPASHELCFAVVAQQAKRFVASPLRIAAVEFTHRAPGDDVAAYRRAFDAPVTFGGEVTQLAFPRAALRLPLASSDPSLLAILARAADELAKKSDPDAATAVAQVSRVLRVALRTDDSSIESVASRLGTPPRTLQRRLRDEGATFQTVRDDVRRNLATRYLDDGLALAEISFLLGFSEPSAFFRAFKRWTGTTPQAARGQSSGARGHQI